MKLKIQIISTHFYAITTLFLLFTFCSVSYGQNTNYGLNAGNAGNDNTAIGADALDVVTGDGNTAVGHEPLKSNTTGDENTGIGHRALWKNVTGFQNTATGAQSLLSNTSGIRNTAYGINSLYSNNTGEGNTASGVSALYLNTTGKNNTAIARVALSSNTTGDCNTAVGFEALQYNTIGSNNTAVGCSSGPSVTDSSLTNTTALGNGTTVDASNQVRLGNTAVTSIGGQVGWTILSDGRFKTAVKEDIPGLEFIDQLRPVSYTVDKAGLNEFKGIDAAEPIDDGGSSVSKRETGFIAQEVESIVEKSGYVFNGVDEARSEKGLYGIRYSMFVVPLVKAVQELSDKAEAQNKTIEELRMIIEKQEQQMNTLLLNVGDGAGNGPSNLNAELFALYPNPFSETATIEMKLAESVENANVMIYTLDGREVKSLPVTTRGKTSVQLDGNQLQAGTYLYTLVADGKVVDTKQMILTK